MMMNANGSNQRAVTAWPAAAVSAEFQPDGRIIYARKNAQDRQEIVTVNPDGSGERIESDESNNSYWGPTAFGHGGQAETLDEWFDPARLKADYVPKGFHLGPGPIQGHPFGLDLPAADKQELIAFLKTL